MVRHEQCSKFTPERKHIAALDIGQQIEQVLQETGLEPSTLKFEITESAIMENAELAVQVLKQSEEFRSTFEHGRFRHWIFIVELPASLPAGHAEDRSIFCGPHL